jgi:hypothetical protein
MNSFAVSSALQVCIRDNPEDARRMLLQNPQLAYALLQAQLVMKIIDPKVADVSMQLSIISLCTLTTFILLGNSSRSFCRETNAATDYCY